MTSDAIRTYLKDGKILVNDLEIVTGMLTVSKNFKPEFVENEKWATASNMKSSVMLDKV